MLGRIRQFFREAKGWNLLHGEWWMIQWQVNWWLSLGVHFDPKRRIVSSGLYEGKSYGPYFDLHLGMVIFSFGWRPYLSGEIINMSGIARGGVSVPTDDDLKISKITLSWRQFVELALILLLALNIWRTFLLYHPHPTPVKPFKCEIEHIHKAHHEVHRLLCESK